MNPDQRAEFIKTWEDSPESRRTEKNKVKAIFELANSKRAAEGETVNFTQNGYRVEACPFMAGNSMAFRVFDDEANVQMSTITFKLKEMKVVVSTGNTVNSANEVKLTDFVPPNPEDVDDLFQPLEGSLGESFNSSIAILESVLIEAAEVERSRLLG